MKKYLSLGLLVAIMFFGLNSFARAEDAASTAGAASDSSSDASVTSDQGDRIEQLKAEFEAKREAAKAEFEAKKEAAKARIDAAKDEAKTRIDEVKKKGIEGKAGAFANKIEALKKKLNHRIDALLKAEKRIKEVSQKLADKGADISAVTAALEKAAQEVTLAKDLISSIGSIQFDPANPKASVEQLREKVKATVESLQNSKKNLNEALKILKESTSAQKEATESEQKENE